MIMQFEHSINSINANQEHLYSRRSIVSNKKNAALNTKVRKICLNRIIHMDCCCLVIYLAFPPYLPRSNICFKSFTPSEEYSYAQLIC